MDSALPLHPPASRVRDFAVSAGSPPIQKKSAVTIGAYMHRNADEAHAGLAGHSFASVEHNGRRETWGFSPQGQYDLTPDSARRLSQNVPGRVHRDDSAFNKPGVRTQTIAVDSAGAEAALDKLSQYRARTPSFHLQQRQCSTFALDMARAAGKDLAPGAKVVKPGDMHAQL